jgi:hypothetical protein
MRTAEMPGSEVARKSPRTGLPALLVLASRATAAAQAPDTTPQIKNFRPAGVRSTLTDSGGFLGFALSNPRTKT